MLWHAQWIGPAFDPRQDIGVHVFRLRLSLDALPEDLLVKVSADQRYKLFVNGQLVSFGPQRGDEKHWFFDVVDLAPYLVEGENLVWALVWNFGWMAPMAQTTLRTGFLVDGDFEPVRTAGGWEVARVDAWDFAMMNETTRGYYMDVGPGEILDGRRLPDWTEVANDPRLDWRPPNVVRSAASRGAVFEPFWGLIPRSVPPMRYAERNAKPWIRHGYAGDPNPGKPDDEIEGPVTLQPGESLLLDYRELLCAYPRFHFEGPAGAVVELAYAESLWETGGGKGNRNEVKGKEMRGYRDRIVLGEGRTFFEPLWWRTYRYLRVTVTEADGPVKVGGIEAIETGYPYETESSFQADDPWVARLWDVSLRTARRCAGETYFDCPYYEQLQYVGDTRIQAMIHYYVSRDRALPRSAVEQFGWSLMDNGLTQSRYPNRVTQVIPPFSLWYVLMRQDQRMYDRVVEVDPNDDEPIDAHGLDVANAYNRLNGEFWNFGDWVPGWPNGVPPGNHRSTMHLLTLYLAHAATEIALDDWSPRAEARAQELWRYMRAQFEKTNGLIRHRNDPGWEPSEHAEALYRVLQSRLGVPIDPWPAKELDDAKAARCTYYFAYYKHQAMRPADYLAQLEPWREMIENGLTTFAENPEPVRSDCHAWSAHPILGFFQIVAGVTSSAPGWRRARIEPRPGSLRSFDALIAHPDGDLRVAYEGGRLTVSTPVEAELHWQGKVGRLAPGTHSVGG